MKSTKIIIKTQSKSYPIYFGEKIINLTGSIIYKNLPDVKKIGIFVDTNVPSIIVKKLSHSLKKYEVKINKENKIQLKEVSDLKFMNLDECLKNIRDYHVEKKKTIINVNKELNKLYI